jgi:hypothetical protein
MIFICFVVEDFIPRTTAPTVFDDDENGTLIRSGVFWRGVLQYALTDALPAAAVVRRCI